MPNIPLTDLRAQYRSLKRDIDHAIQTVLERGQFILGPEVEALERELAAYCGTTEAVAVASGTDALTLSLKACGVGPGDEVITTAFSFIATAEAVVHVGATPVFIDIDPVTYTLDPALIERSVTPRTKTILPVHLFGHPCAMDAVMQIARRRGLVVIEDCAQAIGAQHHGQRVGSFGIAGTLSFYPSKNLGAYGDGGMVVTNEARVADQIRLLRAHGSRNARYHHECLGTNSRLDELQAAILRVKLRALDEGNAARRRNARLYREAFARHAIREVVLPPPESAERLPVYHVYTIRIRRREEVLRRLAACGIATQVYYPLMLPQQPALASLASAKGSYPHAETAAQEVLSLPMYPELRPEDIERIVQSVAQALNPC